MIPTINKPTRVTRNTATAIDQIIKNTVINGIQHRSGIIKTDISDHFPIVFALNPCEKSKPEDKAQFIYKCIYEEEQVELFIFLFKHELGQIEWNNIIKTLDNPNIAYENLFSILFKTYDRYFPTVRIKIIQNPWITKGITKSPKKKPLNGFMNGFLKSVLHRSSE